MSADFDAIIIGGGHNGLVCAAYLARAGRKVVLLEANDRVGGAAITREFAPGFRVSAGAHWLHMLPKSVVEELKLGEHGLSWPANPLPSTLLSLEGLPIGLEEPGLPPVGDAGYPAFMGRLRRLAGALRPMLESTPPRLGTSDWSDRFSLLRLAWQVRRLGRADMRFLLRIIGMNVYDLAEEFVQTPAIRGAVGLDAVLGTRAGPRAPGTVLTLLYRLAGEVGAMPAGLPKGGDSGGMHA